MNQTKKRKRSKAEVKRYHPKVMEHLMQQAQAEDHQRELFAEMDRAAFRHLADFGDVNSD